MKLTVWSTVVVISVLTLTATAQTVLPGWDSVRAVVPGTELRVASEGAKAVRGEFVSATDNSLTIIVGPNRQSFGRAQLVSVSVKKTGHRLRNTLLGLGIGVAVGLTIGFATANQCEGEITCGLAGVTGPIGGTVVGLVWPTGGWRDAYRR